MHVHTLLTHWLLFIKKKIASKIFQVSPRRECVTQAYWFTLATKCVNEPKITCITIFLIFRRGFLPVVGETTHDDITWRGHKSETIFFTQLMANFRFWLLCFRNNIKVPLFSFFINGNGKFMKQIILKKWDQKTDDRNSEHTLKNSYVIIILFVCVCDKGFLKLFFLKSKTYDDYFIVSTLRKYDNNKT